MVKRVERTVARFEPKRVLFLPTGCTLLNLAISEKDNGGWPLGRVVNIIGDKSTGKTLLAEEALTNFQRMYPKGKIHYRETEAAFDADYAQWLGLVIDKVDFGPEGEDSTWSTIEDVFDDLDACLDKVDVDVGAHAKKLRERNRKLKAADALAAARLAVVPSLYIIDSLDGLSSESELGRDIHEGAYNLGKQRIVNELFRHYRKRIRQAKMCLIIISQTRDRIGPFIHGVKYRRVCGDPLNFYSSIVLYLSELGKMTKTIDGNKYITGIRVRARCEKNKIVSPHKQCVFTIRFKYGIDDELSSFDYLEEKKKLKDAGYDKVPTDLSTVDREKLRSAVSKVWRNIDQLLAPAKGKYAA